MCVSLFLLLFEYITPTFLASYSSLLCVMCYVLCCVVLCCVVGWCGDVWCGMVWCGDVWCSVMLCRVMLCCVLLCCVVFCFVVLCGVVWCCVSLCLSCWRERCHRISVSTQARAAGATHIFGPGTSRRHNKLHLWYFSNWLCSPFQSISYLRKLKSKQL